MSSPPPPLHSRPNTANYFLWVTFAGETLVLSREPELFPCSLTSSVRRSLRSLHSSPPSTAVCCSPLLLSSPPHVHLAIPPSLRLSLDGRTDGRIHPRLPVSRQPTLGVPLIRRSSKGHRAVGLRDSRCSKHKPETHSATSADLNISITPAERPFAYL